MTLRAAIPMLSVVALLAASTGALAEEGRAPSGSPPASVLPAGEGTKEKAAPALARREPLYRLAKGDVFDLDFPLTPEFNQPGVTVQPDGYVNLRTVGQLPAAGQTVPEFTEALRRSYAKILHDPVVTVILRDFDKPYFIATGQVARPGKFDLRGDLTVTQGLAMAGGLTMTARHCQVLLFRRMPEDWYEVKKINVKRMLQAGKINEDVHLQSGDMLFVPTSNLGNIKRFIPGWGFSTYVNPIP